MMLVCRFCSGDNFGPEIVVAEDVPAWLEDVPKCYGYGNNTSTARLGLVACG